MAKVISVNDIQSCTKCTNTSEPIGNETSISRLLVSRHYSISSKVNLEFTYDNGESKEITLAIGDEVSVKYTDDSGVLREVVGTITDIRNKEMSESFKSNTSMGNGNYILQFKIDASEEYGSNILSVYLINIYDIEPAEIDPGEEPVVSPIAWKEEEVISVKDGLLYIPYNRVEAGKVELVVSYGEDVVVFKEEFDAESANENATFSWSLRSFESLKGTSIEGLTYDEDGNYVYHNGDNDLASEVRSIDEDDTKIIPAGTPLNIEISHFDSVGSESKITQVYTVTEEDVAAVTLGSSSTTPDEPEEEVKTYTVTSTVINGTVDNETLTVNEGEFATVVFTSDEGYDLVNITINGENTGYTGEVTEDNITVTIDNITEDKVIIATFSKSEEEEPVVPTTYTISNIVTNGTVDNETLTVNEGESATVVFTPEEGYDQVEVTINGVTEDISIVDGLVTVTIDSITEDKTIVATFSKTEVVPITATASIVDGNAVISVANNTDENINATVIVTSSSDEEVYRYNIEDDETEAVPANGSVDVTWNLRKSISGTEEEVYYAENGNDYIVEAGEYTYTVVYEDDKEVTGTITVLEDDTNAAVNDAIWKYGDVVTTSATDKLMTISYNRLVAGDVQLVVKANDSIVFKEEHTFSTINPNANFTWSMRDFSSLNNTSIEGLSYDEDGVYVYHNGDNSHDEVHSIDEDNSKLIPAGTVLDITITIGNSVLVEQYTVTEEDVTNLTH